MPDIDAAQRVLQWFTIAAYLGLLLKIRLTPELRHYRYFALYLGVQQARLIAALVLDTNRNLYGWIWMISAPVLWVCYILVVIELHSLILSKYKGIASFSRYTLAMALGAAVLLSGVTLVFDLSNDAERFPILLAVLIAERWVVSSLSILLIAITGFLLWFPVPLSRNVVIYSLLYFVYFLSKALGLFFRNTLGRGAQDWVNLAMICTASVCLTIWILFLNRAGENVTVKRRVQLKPESERRLLNQLDSINESLMRSSQNRSNEGKGIAL